MRAIRIRRPGGPETLELDEVADPIPGPEEVLVRVRASALNRADLLQRRGLYPAPADCPPDIPGLEFAGEVDGLGPRVRELHVGERVMGIVGGGAHAERLVIHERQCVRVPRGIPWSDAGAIPEAFLTAFDALVEQAHLRAGQTLLVHAAASGVGTAAVQIGTACGATVLGLSRTPDKRRRLEDLGVVHVLDPASDSLVSDILAETGGRGVDIVLELVGAATWSLDLEVLASRGRILLVGTLGGSKVETDLGALMRRRATVVGTVLRARPLEEKISLSREFGRRMLPLFEKGMLRPVVDRVFPFERVREAHERLERNENFGKIVLTFE